MDDMATRLVHIDTMIAGHRDLELRAYWAGDDTEAQSHVDEIARLQHLRDLMERSTVRLDAMKDVAESG